MNNFFLNKPTMYEFFFPFCINEWNNLDENIRNLPSILTFKQAILKFFRPSANSVFRVSDNNGVVLLNRFKGWFQPSSGAQI